MMGSFDLSIAQKVAVAVALPIASFLLYFLLKKSNEEEEEVHSQIVTSRQTIIEIKVPRHSTGSIIGQGGARIKEVQESTGARMQFRDGSDENDERTMVIRGKVEAAQRAELIIRRMIAEIPPIVKDTLNVPERSIGRIIGRGGETIRSLCRSSKCKINIPQEQKLGGIQRILLEGSPSAISTAKALIDEKVKEEEAFRARITVNASNRQERGPRRKEAPSKPASEPSQLDIGNGQREILPIGGTADPPQSTTRAPTTAQWTNQRDYLEVFVSAVEHPGHFWVQVISAKATKLDELSNDMTRYYNNLNDGEEAKTGDIQEGDLLAAPFDYDDLWYRVQVIEVKEDKVDVYYVDFGDSAFVKKSQLKTLRSDFLSLPFQAIEVCLANVKPKGGTWSEEAISLFEDLTYTAKWKVINARTISYTKIDDGEPTPCLELIDTKGTQDVNIAKVLIERGFAEFIQETSISSGTSNLDPPSNTQIDDSTESFKRSKTSLTAPVKRGSMSTPRPSSFPLLPDHFEDASSQHTSRHSAGPCSKMKKSFSDQDLIKKNDLRDGKPPDDPSTSTDKGDTQLFDESSACVFYEPFHQELLKETFLEEDFVLDTDVFYDAIDIASASTQSSLTDPCENDVLFATAKIEDTVQLSVALPSVSSNLKRTQYTEDLMGKGNIETQHECPDINMIASSDETIIYRRYDSEEHDSNLESHRFIAGQFSKAHRENLKSHDSCDEMRNLFYTRSDEDKEIPRCSLEKKSLPSQVVKGKTNSSTEYTTQFEQELEAIGDQTFEAQVCFYECSPLLAESHVGTPENRESKKNIKPSINVEVKDLENIHEKTTDSHVPSERKEIPFIRTLMYDYHQGQKSPCDILSKQEKTFHSTQKPPDDKHIVKYSSEETNQAVSDPKANTPAIIKTDYELHSTPKKDPHIGVSLHVTGGGQRGGCSDEWDKDVLSKQEAQASEILYDLNMLNMSTEPLEIPLYSNNVHTLSEDKQVVTETAEHSGESHLTHTAAYSELEENVISDLCLEEKGKAMAFCIAEDNRTSSGVIAVNQPNRERPECDRYGLSACMSENRTIVNTTNFTSTSPQEPVLLNKPKQSTCKNVDTFVLPPTNLKKVSTPATEKHILSKEHGQYESLEFSPEGSPCEWTENARQSPKTIKRDEHNISSEYSYAELENIEIEKEENSKALLIHHREFVIDSSRMVPLDTECNMIQTNESQQRNLDTDCPVSCDIIVNPEDLLPNYQDEVGYSEGKVQLSDDTVCSNGNVFVRSFNNAIEAMYEETLFTDEPIEVHSNLGALPEDKENKIDEIEQQSKPYLYFQNTTLSEQSHPSDSETNTEDSVSERTVLSLSCSSETTRVQPTEDKEPLIAGNYLQKTSNATASDTPTVIDSNVKCQSLTIESYTEKCMTEHEQSLNTLSYSNLDVESFEADEEQNASSSEVQLLMFNDIEITDKPECVPKNNVYEKPLNVFAHEIRLPGAKMNDSIQMGLLDHVTLQKSDESVHSEVENQSENDKEYILESQEINHEQDECKFSRTDCSLSHYSEKATNPDGIHGGNKDKTDENVGILDNQEDIENEIKPHFTCKPLNEYVKESNLKDEPRKRMLFHRDIIDIVTSDGNESVDSGLPSQDHLLSDDLKHDAVKKWLLIQNQPIISNTNPSVLSHGSNSSSYRELFDACKGEECLEIDIPYSLETSTDECDDLDELDINKSAIFYSTNIKCSDLDLEREQRDKSPSIGSVTEQAFGGSSLKACVESQENRHAELVSSNYDGKKFKAALKGSQDSISDAYIKTEPSYADASLRKEVSARLTGHLAPRNTLTSRRCHSTGDIETDKETEVLDSDTWSEGDCIGTSQYFSQQDSWYLDDNDESSSLDSLEEPRFGSTLGAWHRSASGGYGPCAAGQHRLHTAAENRHCSLYDEFQDMLEKFYGHASLVSVESVSSTPYASAVEDLPSGGSENVMADSLEELTSIDRRYQSNLNLSSYSNISQDSLNNITEMFSEVGEGEKLCDRNSSFTDDSIEDPSQAEESPRVIYGTQLERTLLQEDAMPKVECDADSSTLPASENSIPQPESTP